MISVNAEISFSIAGASGLSATCSMLTVPQHRQTYHQLIDMSVAYSSACIQEVTCGLVNT